MTKTSVKMVQKAILVQKTSARRSYANGYKYCSRCRVYHLTDGVRCPYCGILLRNSPRKKKPSATNRYVRMEL